jgi:hypothetical protein
MGIGMGICIDPGIGIDIGIMCGGPIIGIGIDIGIIGSCDGCWYDIGDEAAATAAVVCDWTGIGGSVIGIPAMPPPDGTTYGIGGAGFDARMAGSSGSYCMVGCCGWGCGCDCSFGGTIANGSSCRNRAASCSGVSAASGSAGSGAGGCCCCACACACVDD